MKIYVARGLSRFEILLGISPNGVQTVQGSAWLSQEFYDPETLETDQVRQDPPLSGPYPWPVR